VARLRSDFWVAAYLRQCAIEMIDAVLRRRGAAEAGTIFVKVDHRDGTASLFGPAPQSLVESGSSPRLFATILDRVAPLEVEDLMRREMKFDPDLWLLEIDSATRPPSLDIADEPGTG
jgi:hypothetical protein